MIHPSPKPAPILLPRRILLVEGDQKRADLLQGLAECDCDLTPDPDQAIGWLQERVYSDLWLNHDLGHEPAHPGQVGRKVSLWLCSHPEVQPWLVTRIHSMNPVSAPKIERELCAAGRPATWVPLRQIVDEVKARLANGH